MLKEDIYRELSEKKGERISGQELADAYHVTRTAVWKAIRSLQEEGFPVESVGRKGYRLDPDADLLTEEGIRAYLTSGCDLSICLYRRIDSTNAQAERMIADGYRGKALIAAEEQTCGRGHNRTSFDSPAAEGLYMTLLLPLRFPFQHVSEISRAAGQAVLESLGTVPGHHFRIEEISDIYDGDKKISGVLCEVLSADLESGCTDTVIIGIGIHLTTLHSHFTRDRLAASVTDHMTHHIDGLTARFCSPA